MAVLAQVHVGWRHYLNASKQYERADQQYRVEKELSDLTTARANNNTQSELERISGQTSALAAALRRYQAYAQLQLSLGRLYATLGRDLLPSSTAAGNIANRDLPALTKEVALGLRSWHRGAGR
jgi:hypothetical protein